jgi:peptidoglycan/xylan/chitin deacetylase (PgdA/CDA1 family)
MDYLLRKATPANPFDPVVRGPGHHVAVTFDDAYVSTVVHAVPECRSRSIPCAVFVPSGYLGKKPGWVTDEYAEFRDHVIIDDRQLLELKDAGVLIGSHTRSHPHLPQCLDQELEEELSGSRSALEKITGASVEMLSLPFGSHDDRVMAAARKAGYRRVFLNIPTSPSTDFDAETLGRIDITCEDWEWEYRLKILGAYEWQAAASRIKHFVLGLASRQPK